MAAPAPGRTCPLSYRYGAQALARAADFSASTVYVVGGMYGNPYALAAIIGMRAREPEAVLVFNGDFNWFDVGDADFTAVNQAVLRHRAIRGNVETELLAESDAAGCGCGYPDYVGDADVARSNRIMELLKQTARRQPTLSGQVSALPMNLVAEVGGVRVGIVHGDAESLAGWAFGEEAIKAAPIGEMFDRAQVRVFASSHTCLPVAQVFKSRAGPAALFNNGTAGLPNFAGTRFGLLTRIGAAPAPAGLGALYGTVVGGVHVDALPIAYDHAAWLKHFDAAWPAQSPAALSYRKRIVEGPRYELAQAPRAGVAMRAESGAPLARRAA
jgi:hypothetical protein